MSETVDQFSGVIRARVYQQVGDDHDICQIARVSTRGVGNAGAVNELRDKNLISYLMEHKHGSPFEHGLVTFEVLAPIFVFWDHVRHRIGVSYNVESSRYRELEGTFFIPDRARTQQGRPGQYVMTPGTPEQTRMMQDTQKAASEHVWSAYKAQLAVGIAREQAMQILSMNTMVSAYVTFNPRSIMKFLELRLGPAREEVRDLAGWYYDALRAYWPVTAAAFESNGRICP